MPRAATTSDVFNAIAEPQRRRILVLLKGGEHAVNDVADALELAQPVTSKHLRVLREVGLVQAREAGRQRLYRLDADGLRRVHEWTGGFADFWQGSLDRLEEYARELQSEPQQEPQREEEHDAGSGNGS